MLSCNRSSQQEVQPFEVKNWFLGILISKGSDDLCFGCVGFSVTKPLLV